MISPLWLFRYSFCRLLRYASGGKWSRCIPIHILLIMLYLKTSPISLHYSTIVHWTSEWKRVSDIMSALNNVHYGFGHYYKWLAPQIVNYMRDWGDYGHMKLFIPFIQCVWFQVFQSWLQLPLLNPFTE